ncbi:hypothetical protein [Geofilum rhodophaeum]|uniref:hypothetical protein n=1 Tax=Geofilum rhodophaeum TaxID=1965019 RepID=UPI0011BA975C|nr:hypothetical protein [Geofilum rhodophaeum]
MITQPSYCLFCETELKGRSDKQFCTPHCKSLYHNRKPNSDEAYIRGINQQIRKNRSALRTACPLGKATVSKNFLKKLGMDFKYLTHSWKSNGGNLYYFCYDYGYMQVDDPNKVLIIQQQQYMDK